MPRAFDIVPLVPSVKPNAQGKAELSFSVSNKLNRAVRAKATPEAEGSTRKEWLSVVGAAERDFAADGTQQITIQVQAPPGTPPGTYGLHLLVATLNNPDEEYANGPAVNVEVPATEPPAKPFPWWIVALAVGVLVIGGGAMLLFSKLKGANIGDPCDGPSACGEKLVCVEKTCLAKAGGKCDADKDCETQVCKNEVCAPVVAGSPCLAGSRCPSLMSCVGGKCLGERGYATCATPADCATGFCKGTTCDFRPPGANCVNDSGCPPNQRCITLTEGMICALRKGEPCDGDLQCASLYCPPTNKCSRDDGCSEATEREDCRPGVQVCRGNACVKVNGQNCDQPAKCASNYCLAGKCAACSTALDCGPLTLFNCVSGVCRHKLKVFEGVRSLPAEVVEDSRRNLFKLRINNP